MSDVEITANGEERRIPEGTTLRAFLQALDLPEARVAVEHNGKIVPRERFPSLVLSPGDRLEVVTLVGGG
jgi:thiamine biosynthesis protein ThiS